MPKRKSSATLAQRAKRTCTTVEQVRRVREALNELDLNMTYLDLQVWIGTKTHGNMHVPRRDRREKKPANNAAISKT